jgi:hypothetical protein
MQSAFICPMHPAFISPMIAAITGFAGTTVALFGKIPQYAAPMRQLTGKIVCTVGRASPTGCLRCQTALRRGGFPCSLGLKGVDFPG